MKRQMGERGRQGWMPYFRRGTFSLVTLFFFMLNATLAFALPSGPQVVNGQASFTTQGNTLTITNTPNAIINWQAFSIGSNETTRFLQQSASSAVLNRIMGQNPSLILGALQSNGKVLLINPNGILFGQGARIDVGGLVASTLNLSNQDFLAGKFNFTLGNSGAGGIQNQGRITTPMGGFVYLIAPNVENSGIITSPKGDVILAAGHSVQLVDSLNPDIAVVVSAPEHEAVNIGQIVAESGKVGIYGGLIKQKGLVSANSAVVGEGGKIIFKAKDITLEQGSVTEAKGGGGQIKVLGDMKEGSVRVSGSLDASAPNGGDGGFIETSAATVKVDDSAFLSTLAPYGKSGQWLLDPYDLTIAASGGDVTGTAISTALQSTGVTLQTTGTGISCTGVTCSGSGNASGNGDIFVNDAISWSGSTTLTLSAYRNIEINQPITATGVAAGARLSLLYGQGAVASGNTASYIVRAPVGLPAGGDKFTATLGSDGTALTYTVINSLGSAGSVTGTDLQGMAGNLSGRYVLGSDIDASATSTWNSGAGFAPIGSASSFTGTFDGLGHTINSLYINNTTSSSPIGLFGYNGGTVRNITLKDVNISTTQSYVGGLAGNNTGIIGNAHINGGTVTVTGSGWMYAGGMVARNYGTITGSDNTASLIISGADKLVGGLVGWNISGGNIDNSYNGGSISVSGSPANYGDGTGVGGLVGGNGGTINASYNNGSVTISSGSINNHLGGLIGQNDSGGIINSSYSSGKVSAPDSNAVGGLVGINGGTFTNSYWDTQTSGQSTSTGGTGLTTAQMMDHNNYSGWDFTGTWWMSDSDTRPFLRSEWSTRIGNAHQLQLMALNLGASYSLVRDINLSEVKLASGMWNTNSGFVPIGTGGLSGTPFTGTFSGNGYTIGNLFINRPSTSNIGLFGSVSASTIKNTGILNADVKGYDSTGILIGGVSNSTISNSYSTGAVSGHSDVGGLIGGTSSSSISNAYSSATVTGGGSLGGLVGYNNSTISNSYSSGSVSGGSDVGGLVGYSWGAAISNSYNTGAVSGSSSVGGLVGYLWSGSVTNAYSSGVVSGSSSVGGLVGYKYTGSVSGSYWDKTINSGSSLDNGYGTGLTTTQMMTQASYSGWDFGATWYMFGSDTRPFLRSEYSTKIANAHQLQLMDMNTSASYSLIRDIDMSELTSPSGMWNTSTGFVPIGFSGAFDGQGHTISGLYINRPSTDDVGLFSWTDPATVKNVGLLGGSVTGQNTVGGLVGQCWGCVISNSFYTGSVNGQTSVGGLVGDADGSSSISNSYAISSVAGSSYVGGLVGSHAGTITNSFSTGAVTGSTSGGLVGYNSGGTVSNSFWDTDTSGQTTSAGGTGMTTAQMMTQANFTSATAANGNVNPNWDFTNTWWMSDGNTRPFLRSEWNTTITNAHQLQLMPISPGANYILANDIDLSSALAAVGGKYPGMWGSAGFVPVGNSTTNFTGTFDGGGHTISNLSINRTTSNVGLFGYANGATVQNVSLTNAGIIGSSNVGGLVGYAVNGLTIGNSSIAGSVTGSGSYVGGLVGYINRNGGSFSINNSHNAAAVTGYGNVGGLVGYINSYSSGGSSSISNSYSTGAVSGSNGSYVGGLVGYLNVYGANSTSSISNSYSTGAVNGGTAGYTGGLIGYLNVYGSGASSSIGNSWNTGAVSGSGDVGGLVGYLNVYGANSTSSISNSYSTGTVSIGSGWYAGGLVGYLDIYGASSASTIDTSYNTGAVSGNGDIGGLVGYSSNSSAGTISSSYNTGTVSGSSNTGGLVGNLSMSTNGAATISDSYNTGTVSSSGGYVGGIVGYLGLYGNGTSGSIMRSWNTGNVSGDSSIGGIVGEMDFGGTNNTGTISNSYNIGAITGSGVGGNVGGLVGDIFLFGTGGASTISNSYSSGAVSGISSAGGLVGNADATGGAIGVNNSYWDTQTSGQSISAGGTGLTTAQMMDHNNYSGWDFTNTWWMSDSDTRPFLRSEYSTRIGNAHQLQLMILNPSASYSLIRDIDMSEIKQASGMWNTTTGFIPVGDATNKFTGSLDGKGYVISNLFISRPGTDYVGLFGSMNNAYIQNVGLSNLAVTGNNYTGGLAGYVYSGTIDGLSGTGSVSGTKYVGGLAGYAVGGNIKNSSNSAAVSGGSYVGGLVGATDKYWDNGERVYVATDINDSYNSGAVSGTNYVGGLVGYNPGSINTSYNSGAVSGAGYVGGLAGYNYNDGTYYSTLDNSYSTGNVNGTDYVGGLVGRNDGGTISRAYSSGLVSGSTNTGGLAGASNVAISNSFWDKTVNSGLPDNGYGTGKTTSELMDPGTYSGWSYFSSYWYMINGETRPFLRSEYSTQIKNAHQLQLMAMNPAASYTLIRDIDMSELAQASGMWNTGNGFMPIGDSTTKFTGTFDGNGHTITGLAINRASTDHVGLFGYTDTTSDIRNVGLLNVNIIGQNYVGALVGDNDGVISNSYSTGSISGSSSVGGLIGMNGYGTISNSYSNGTVSGVEQAGGLVGAMWGNRTLSSSYSSGAVSGNYRVGGLVGINNQGTITESYSTGSVTAISGAYPGGSKIGGLVGENYLGTISNSYSTGYVTGSTAGGLVGYNSGGTVTSSYWDKNTSGWTTSAGGTGLTTSSMMTQASYSGWDFTNTWGIVEGVSYPYLKWQFSGTPQIISGSIASGYSGGEGIQAVVNGTPLAFSYAGKNGFYYFALPGNSVPNGTALLTYLSNDSIKGADLHLSNGGYLTGLSLIPNTLTMSGAGTLSNTSLVNAKGSLTSTDIPYSVSGNNITLANGFNFVTGSGVSFILNGNVTTGIGGSQTYNGLLSLAANATLTSAGDITFNNAVSGGSYDLTLDAAGTVTQASTAPITAAGLSLLTGTYALNNSGNSITTLAGNAASITFASNYGFGVGTVQGYNGITVSNYLSLNSNGAVTQSQPITAPSLTLLGTGSYTLENAGNAVDILAANTGSVSFTNSKDLAIGSVNGTNGLTTTGDAAIYAEGRLTIGSAKTLVGTVVSLTGHDVYNYGTISGSSGVTVNAGSGYLLNAGLITNTGGTNTSPITLISDDGDISGGMIQGGAAVVTLRPFTSNGINTLGGSGETNAELNTITTTGAIQIGDSTVTGTINIASDLLFTSTPNLILQTGGDISIGGKIGISGNLTLNSGGTVTQTAAISAAGLELSGKSSHVILTNAANAVNVIAGEVGSLSFTNSKGFLIGTVNGTSLLAAGGDLTLSSGGAISQTAAIKVSGVTSLTAKDDITLGAITAEGSLNVSSTGAITGSGVLAGTALSATAGKGINLAGDNTIAVVSLTNTGSGDIIYSSSIGAGTNLDITGSNTALAGAFKITEKTGGMKVRSITTKDGDITLAGAGDLNLLSLVDAGKGKATLTSTGGAIIDGNDTTSSTSNNIAAGSFIASAANGIGSNNAIETQVSSLDATNSGSQNVEITNKGALTIGTLSSGGNVLIDNTGAVTTGASLIQSTGGEVSIVAHSPLTIGSGGVSAYGNVSLEAAASGSGDDLTINGNITSLTEGITLKAGGSITGAGKLDAPKGFVKSDNLNNPPPSKPKEDEIKKDDNYQKTTNNTQNDLNKPADNSPGDNHLSDSGSKGDTSGKDDTGNKDDKKDDDKKKDDKNKDEQAKEGDRKDDKPKKQFCN